MGQVENIVATNVFIQWLIQWGQTLLRNVFFQNILYVHKNNIKRFSAVAEPKPHVFHWRSDDAKKKQKTNWLVSFFFFESFMKNACFVSFFPPWLVIKTLSSCITTDRSKRIRSWCSQRGCCVGIHRRGMLACHLGAQICHCSAAKPSTKVKHKLQSLLLSLWHKIVLWC